MTLSNLLTDLAECTKEEMAKFDAAHLDAIKAGIAAGALLVSAKTECGHGQWLPFLAHAGVQERRAQRLMTLARSGLKSDTVSDLGGITGALDWLQRFRLPEPEQVLLVDLNPEGAPSPPEQPFAYVWLTPEGFHVVMFDLGVTPHTIRTRRPILPHGSEMVRHFVLHALDYRAAEMNFLTLPEQMVGSLRLLDDVQIGGEAS